MILKNYICCFTKDPINVKDLPECITSNIFLKGELKEVDMICFSGIEKEGFIYRTFQSRFVGDIPQYRNLKVSGAKRFYISLDYHHFLFMLRMLKFDGEYLYLGGLSA